MKRIIYLTLIVWLYSCSENNQNKINQVILTQAQIDSINTVRLAEERNKKVEILSREIESIKKGIDFSVYRGSIESLQIEIALFSAWYKIVNENNDLNDKKITKLCNELKNMVIQVQIKEFPKLRKDYSKVVNSKMWEHDITVFSSGNKSNIINFTGGIFAANKNIKDFQTQLQSVLEMFRFKQSNYRWYKESDEYTYYTITSHEDSEFLEIK